ncbi:MAG TPA: hypothetical protein VES65_02020 [Solirubrobacteraceae bacterium]|nr:hypothetical protein [Solirubrobacteraceae bacterium]
MTNGGNSPPTRRLIVVCRGDETGRYDWLPAPRAGDATVALDGMAAEDLADRQALPFDELETWEQRSAAEHRIDELLAAVRAAPAVTAIELSGYRLIDFAEYRLRMEAARLLRGWTLARALEGVGELACDPTAAPALVMGVRAGIGLDPATTPYEIPPEVPGSRVARAAIRPVMRCLAAVSRPARVRVAAVAAGKLILALDAMTDADLRAAGVATMPFPGLDHGNSAVVSLRRRLPMVATFGGRATGPGPAVRLPERLDLASEPQLDSALTVLITRLLDDAASELAGAVGALARIERASELRALLLPTAALGASRLLISWAHRRGVRVGVIQHGIYAHREFDGADRSADVVFAWGEGTAEQAQGWPEPRPKLLPVGVPGMAVARTRPPVVGLRRALIATSNAVDAPTVPAAFCKTFVDVLAPGLARMAAAGVELQLRPHPAEDRKYYRRLLSRHGLDIPIANDDHFSAAAARTDILISSASSVAFEAAALGLPVLMWLGPAPRWVREEHLVTPWVESSPGMFQRAEEFASLADDLLDRPAEAFAVAYDLGRLLARYARPFDPDRFAEGLRMLAA